MTVKELIEILQTMDQNKIVLGNGESFSDYHSEDVEVSGVKEREEEVILEGIWG